MTLDETLAALKAMGTAQNRKVYARHGAGDDTFGVSFADLRKLAKGIGRNQALASELWKTGNSDARSLATLITDPKAIPSRDLDQWVKSITYYVHADLFARYVSGPSPHARSKAETWTKSKHDFTGQCGFDTLAILAMGDTDLPDSYFEEWLTAIETKIHKASNRTKHAMNGALIAIGLRNPALRMKALAAAARIGKVEVDHGETNCKTPDAAAYIQKAAARKSAKA